MLLSPLMGSKGGQWLPGTGWPCSKSPGIVLRGPGLAKPPSAAGATCARNFEILIRAGLCATLLGGDSELVLGFFGGPASSRAFCLLGEPTPSLLPGPMSLWGPTKLLEPWDPKNMYRMCPEFLAKPPPLYRLDQDDPLTPLPGAPTGPKVLGHRRLHDYLALLCFS